MWIRPQLSFPSLDLNTAHRPRSSSEVGIASRKSSSRWTGASISSVQPARGDVPMFSFTDVAALAKKQYHGDRNAAVEALGAQRAEREIRAQPSVCRREGNRCLRWAVALASLATCRHGRADAVSPGSALRHQGGAKPWPGHEVADAADKAHPRHVSRRRSTAARRYLQVSEFGTDVSACTLPRRPRNSPAHLRRCATRTCSIAPTRKPRGQWPSSRSPASTGRAPASLTAVSSATAGGYMVVGPDSAGVARNYAVVHVYKAPLLSTLPPRPLRPATPTKSPAS